MTKSNLWEAVELLTLLDDMTKQRDKLISFVGTQRKELESVKSQLANALNDLGKFKTYFPKEYESINFEF
jgi:predicted component of type VI protein secretion system